MNQPEPRYSSSTPDKGAAAQAGHGTVSAVVPMPERDVVPGEPDRGPDRTEEYDTTAPDGRTVTVSRNIETGETTIIGGG